MGAGGAAWVSAAWAPSAAGAGGAACSMRSATDFSSWSMLAPMASTLFRMPSLLQDATRWAPSAMHEHDGRGTRVLEACGHLPLGRWQPPALEPEASVAQPSHMVSKRVRICVSSPWTNCVVSVAGTPPPPPPATVPPPPAAAIRTPLSCSPHMCVQAVQHGLPGLVQTAAQPGPGALTACFRVICVQADGGDRGGGTGMIPGSAIGAGPLDGNPVYEFVRTIGRGQRSLVQVARHRLTGQLVAIKFLPRGALRRGGPGDRSPAVQVHGQRSGPSPAARVWPPRTPRASRCGARSRLQQASVPSARHLLQCTLPGCRAAGWEPNLSKYVARQVCWRRLAAVVPWAHSRGRAWAPARKRGGGHPRRGSKRHTGTHPAR